MQDARWKGRDRIVEREGDDGQCLCCGEIRHPDDKTGGESERA